MPITLVLILNNVIDLELILSVIELELNNQLTS